MAKITITESGRIVSGHTVAYRSRKAAFEASRNACANPSVAHFWSASGDYYLGVGEVLLSEDECGGQVRTQVYWGRAGKMVTIKARDPRIAWSD